MIDSILEDIYIDGDEASSQLQAAFHSPFSVWEEDAGAWAWSAGDDEPEIDAELSAWLSSQQSQLERGQAVSLQTSRDGLLLAVPVNSPDDPLAVAVGRLPANPGSLAACAGTLARSALLGTAAVDDLSSAVDEYRMQVTEDFEERTFLRHIARYVEHCSAARDLESVTRELLPRLRKLARLESIHLVSAHPAGEDRVPRPDRVVVTDPPLPVASPEPLRLVERFGVSDSSSPVVRSIDRCPELREIGPDVDSISITALVRENDHYGWLVAINRETVSRDGSVPLAGLSENEIGSGEASLLEATSILLASHAHNRQLFQDKEQLVVELVRSLVGVLDARDEYTCGHSDRVASMARLLASCTGLSPAACETVYLSGLLHDLGKIGVTDDVLLKPGRLTDEEFAEIKEHPQRGYDILKRLEPLKDMLPGVLHHHEAWDGSGYPHGLAGEDIPPIARILAIADTFDALTSSRPYREGMPLGKATDILKNGAGQQWDADLVGVFLDRIHQMVEVCQSSRDRRDSLLRCDATDMNNEGSGEIEAAVALRNVANRQRTRDDE